MQQRIYSIPLEKLIEYEIMEDNLPRGEENARHFYFEEENEEGLQEGATFGISIEIGKFFQLPHRMLQAPRTNHEPLINYSQSQILTSVEHIQSLQDIAHKKSIVAQIMQEKARVLELTKVKRAADMLQPCRRSLA